MNSGTMDVSPTRAEDYFKYIGNQTNTDPSEWARISVRVLHHERKIVGMMQLFNAKTNQSFLVYQHGERALAYFPAGPYEFNLRFSESNLIMRVRPFEDQEWNRELKDIFALIYRDIYPVDIVEVSAGTFRVAFPSDWTIEHVKAIIIGAGLVWNENIA